jgi:hypothetical protein
MNHAQPEWAGNGWQWPCAQIDAIIVRAALKDESLRSADTSREEEREGERKNIEENV